MLLESGLIANVKLHFLFEKSSLKERGCIYYEGAATQVMNNKDLIIKFKILNTD